VVWATLSLNPRESRRHEIVVAAQSEVRICCAEMAGVTESTRLPLRENRAPATRTTLSIEVKRLFGWSLIWSEGICFTVSLNSTISWAKSVRQGGQV
jgi:hypothetical protein